MLNLKLNQDTSEVQQKKTISICYVPSQDGLEASLGLFLKKYIIFEEAFYILASQNQFPYIIFRLGDCLLFIAPGQWSWDHSNL